MYLPIFPNSKKFSDFPPKNFRIKLEKTFSRNNIIYAFYSKFATFSEFEKFKFFLEKPIYVSKKKTKFCTFGEILHLTRILPQICCNLVIKNFQTQYRTLASSRTLAICKNVKKTFDFTVLSG